MKGEQQQTRPLHHYILSTTRQCNRVEDPIGCNRNNAVLNLTRLTDVLPFDVIGMLSLLAILCRQ